MAMVLVIDDNAPMRRTLVRFLTRLGHRVIEADDGASAKTAWDANAASIDLCVTDGQYPGGGAPDFIAYVRDQSPHKNPAMPIIVVTGNTHDFRKLQAANPGLASVPVVEKGVNTRQDFEQAVRQFVPDAPQAPPPAVKPPDSTP